MTDEVKQPDPEKEVQVGNTKIPVSLIITLAGMIIGGGGGLAYHTSQIDELRKAQDDIVEIKTDIRWIKDRLSPAGAQTSYSQSPEKPAPPVPNTSSPTCWQAPGLEDTQAE